MNVEHLHAMGVLQNIHDTTPGGIRREQVAHKRHPLKTALACLPFAAFIALAIYAASTHAAAVAARPLPSVAAPDAALAGATVASNLFMSTVPAVAQPDHEQAGTAGAHSNIKANP